MGDRPYLLNGGLKGGKQREEQATRRDEEDSPKVETHLKELVVPAFEEIKREMAARGVRVEFRTYVRDGVGTDVEGIGVLHAYRPQGRGFRRGDYTVYVGAEGIQCRLYRTSKPGGGSWSASAASEIVDDFLGVVMTDPHFLGKRS